MNLPVSGVNQPGHTAPTAPNAANPLTAGAIASTQGSGASSSTTINSMADLKKKAPELYQKMLEGIAMGICNSMKDHQERLKKLMRESTRNG